ncbi:mce associated protein mas1a [Rhodococcus gannanensis]|uniref:Mce associated protein mas1a n=1 Tax=Rhodococcus gannanensis TaxID=1960308 RepID=A0ABW4P9X9_9NOCA
MANDDTALIDITDDAGATPEKTSGPTGPRRRGVWLPVVLAVALLAVAGWLAFTVVQNGREDSLREEAVDTARDYSVALSSFDFENLDANRDAITAQSTPEFAGKYGEMVDALRQVVTDGKGKATASAAHVAVESIDDSDATVLVFVDQQATNVVNPEGNTQKYRMVVSLVRDGDRWIVDNVDTK